MRAMFVIIFILVLLIFVIRLNLFFLAFSPFVFGSAQTDGIGLLLTLFERHTEWIRLRSP